MAEFKVIEVAGLDQLCYINMTLDTVLVEGLLEDLVVFDEFVLVLGAPLDSLVGEGTWEERVENGAVNGTSCTLLNLGQLQLKVRVEPVKEFLFAHEVGLIHHSNRL